MLRKLEKAFTYVAATVLALYASIVLLFSLPAMQTKLAEWTASLLSEELGATVEIRSANIGFLNRVIINDLTLYEPSGKKMATVARASASLDIFSLFSGRIVVNTAQLFGVNATLYKDTPDSEPNFQFIIDALKGDDQESSPIDLCINSFIMRRTNVSYDIKSEPVKKVSDEDGTVNSGIRLFDTNHLALRNCGMNLSLRFITNDSIDCRVKRLQAMEAHSGLRLQNSQLAMSANKQHATITAFHIEMPHSTCDLDTFHIEYPNYIENKEFAINETHFTATVSPADLSPLFAKLGYLKETVSIAATISGDNKQLNITDFSAAYDGVAECSLNAQITSPLTDSRVIDATINTLALKTDGIRDIALTANADSTLLARLTAIGNIDYSGTVHATAHEIESKGALKADASSVSYDFTLNSDKQMLCRVNADSVAVGLIAGIHELGKASFSVTAAGDLAKGTIENLDATISSLEYKDYKYQDIKVAVSNLQKNSIQGTIDIDDENLALNIGIAYSDNGTKHMQLNAQVDKCVPHNLNLTDKYPDESLMLTIAANLEGYDINTLAGAVSIDNISITTPADKYEIDKFCLTSEHTDNQSTYIISSDFLNAKIEGKARPTEFAPSVVNILAHHLPQLIHPVHTKTTAEFDYHMTVSDCALLRHLVNVDYQLDKPLTISGNVNSGNDEFALTLNAPKMHYEGTSYNNIALVCSTSPQNLHTELIGFSLGDDGDNSNKRTDVNISADAHSGIINSLMNIAMNGDNSMTISLKPTIALTDSLGTLQTHVTLDESQAMINDTVWTILPAIISIHEKNIACHGLKCVNSAGSSIAIDGAVSDSPRDSLIAILKDVEIKYILELVDFSAVRFAGKASGQATLRGLMAKEQGIDLNAHLKVKGFTLQEGSMGDADIRATWNKENESIELTASFLDHYQNPIDLSNFTEDVTGRTSLTGWISPAKNDMRLDIMTDNTNAAFLHGFLDGVFSEMSGTLSGPVSIVGLSPVNIIGKAAANISMRLRATNVPYQIKGDTVRLEEDLITFPTAVLYDKYGNSGLLQATIRHHNMKNFQYSIHGDLNGLCAYDETQFNSDKFYATVFTRGTIDVNGADGHPLRINADITPTRGSVFAYDAATPDAIITSSFVEFTDRQAPISAQGGLSAPDSTLLPTPSIADNFTNDIYFNANIHLTPDCEVNLRMDNIDDGYMRTYGYADLNAQWHNKGSFQLFGNYNIQGGSYRLYLQNLIFRDLALQPASSVEFNGNPFDAAIHLVCNHTIPSVPVSDLTSTKAFSQNNKVRVNCILDITGFLEKMDFKFDMELLNVNDEMRQLVRSMINSDEEMNTQMIYLLGFGRFYPTEYARNSGNSNSEQAVNSLLSSTLSGQINQLLSNMIGQNSNWTFGSTLTTGETGWDDLDVEGNVSGRLLNECLLVNGNFGYRDNALTNQANFIGDFEVKLKLTEKGNVYVKAYNQANDRYFTKATLNTQGLGLSWQLDFDSLFPRRSSLLMQPAIVRKKQ